MGWSEEIKDMAKVSVCDVEHDTISLQKQPSICTSRDIKTSELTCVHIFEVQRKFPKVSVGYVQFIYEMVHGIELSPEDAENVLRRRR